MSDQSLAGMATPAVEGRMTVEAALKRLVKGSGASIRRIDATTWRIVRTPAVVREQPRARIAQPAPQAAPEPAEIIVTASKREIGRAHVELQSLMRISSAVFCLKKKQKTTTHTLTPTTSTHTHTIQ